MIAWVCGADKPWYYTWAWSVSRAGYALKVLVGSSATDCTELDKQGCPVNRPTQELFIMAMVKCKECGKEVSTQAQKCPHCGVTKPAIKGRVITGKEIAGAIIVFLIIGAVIKSISP